MCVFIFFICWTMNIRYLLYILLSRLIIDCRNLNGVFHDKGWQDIDCDWVTASLLTWYVDLAIVHWASMGSQRLRQRRHVVPLVGLQVVGLHAGEVAALVPTTNHVQVLIQAAGKETGSPEEGSVNQTTSLNQQWQEIS